MDLKQAIRERHSVRSYLDKPIDNITIKSLENVIDECNKESDLNIQLVKNEPKAFNSTIAHYGKFSGVNNYIALIGKKNKSLEEKCGYYGEKIVLHAQTLGLNTCWVALTYKKIPDAFTVKDGEKLTAVIAIGYGKSQGVEHKSKSFDEVTKTNGNIPEWFKKGVEYALLAPTATNQQKFILELDGNSVIAKTKFGFYNMVGLGIVKYHFEIGSEKGSEIWK